MSKIVIAGGGIIGLSSAYFLRKSGHDVTVIDKTDMTDSCSYGNAGYVCPGHFIPMATPGIVKQGLKWMLNPLSPFYVQPRLDAGLADWGIKFMRSANKKHVLDSAVPLRDIAILSKDMYELWKSDPAFDFFYRPTGLLEMFRTTEGAAHGAEIAHRSRELGLDVDMLDASQTRAMEPQLDMNVEGAIYFRCDAHLDPGTLMQNLLRVLKDMGVKFLEQDAVVDFRRSGNSVTNVITQKSSVEADQVILATGSWSRELASKLGIKIPLVAGRGYSVTVDDSIMKVNYPIILAEGRVAITPLSNNRIRFGGTMEITSLNTPPRYNRVQGILNGVKSFFPSFNMAVPDNDKIWYGYRPCSADGLPYIGRDRKFSNVVIATGHAMIGLSLGAGTGKLVSELVNEEATSIDLKPFDPGRFN